MFPTVWVCFVLLHVQYIVKSKESFEYANVDTLTPKSDYDLTKDAQRFLGEGSKITLTKGDFIVFSRKMLTYAVYHRMEVQVHLKKLSSRLSPNIPWLA